MDSDILNKTSPLEYVILIENGMAISRLFVFKLTISIFMYCKS